MVKKVTKKIVISFLILLALASLLLLLIRLSIYLNTDTTSSVYYEDELSLTPFPLGVNPATKTIVEQPEVETYYVRYVASNHTAPRIRQSWFSQMASIIEKSPLYQNLASPTTRTAVIWSGERHEQVATNFARLFDWDQAQTDDFITMVQSNSPGLTEGIFYPGKYNLDAYTAPSTAALAITERFQSEVLLRYPNEISAVVPLEEILVIASLIEREAYDFEDMRVISGVIWNRLFIGMPLQIDATLQYVRGQKGNNRAWWPIPKSKDKFIESPYNTYLNPGLPPTPIANPSIDAIIAALNPRQTNCLFYLHDETGKLFCSENYEDHLKNISDNL